jgi:3-oxoacyl-[acyl-carrier protein] reductase
MGYSVPPVEKLLDLTSRTAIVTGASGGIGGAIAQRLADAGARVAVHYHSNQSAAQSVVDRIEACNGEARAVVADLREESGCATLLEETQQHLGRATVLVNNAGIQPVGALLQLTDDETSDVLRSNVSAPLMLTRLFARQFADSNHAQNCCVTNVASIEGSHPAAGHSHYASSKAALIMFSRAAAQELGPLGIRVNSVSPGLIDRPDLERDWPQGVDRYKTAAPLGRIGQAADIADAVLFLSSDAARWISGTNLVVDGGVSCAPTW